MWPSDDAAAVRLGTGSDVLMAPFAAGSINTASTTGTAGRAGAVTGGLAVTGALLVSGAGAGAGAGTGAGGEGATPEADCPIAAANRSSPPPGSGSVRIKSNAMARGLAALIRSSKAACTPRGHGQRPIFSRLPSSIATMTISADGLRPRRDRVAS